MNKEILSLLYYLIYEKQNWFFRDSTSGRRCPWRWHHHIVPHLGTYHQVPFAKCGSWDLCLHPFCGRLWAPFEFVLSFSPRAENCSDRQPLRSDDLCLLFVSFWGPPVATSKVRWSAEAYRPAESVEMRLMVQTRAIALPNSLCFLTAWTHQPHLETRNAQSRNAKNWRKFLSGYSVHCSSRGDLSLCPQCPSKKPGIDIYTYTFALRKKTQEGPWSSLASSLCLIRDL